MPSYDELIDIAADIQDEEQFDDVASLALELSDRYEIGEQEAHEIAEQAFGGISQRDAYSDWYVSRAEAGWGE